MASDEAVFVAAVVNGVHFSSSSPQSQQPRQRLTQLSVYAIGPSGTSTLVNELPIIQKKWQVSSFDNETRAETCSQRRTRIGTRAALTHPGKASPPLVSFPLTPPIHHTAVGRASERGHVHVLLHKQSNQAKHSPDALNTRAASLPALFLYTITWWQ